ncbi:MAG: acetyl-CoA C-acyltransferase [Phycisphaeraceae bacterium]|nr:acetyl-CoA C-acyltransferase [Phycisphaeraceae bacterium]
MVAWSTDNGSIAVIAGARTPFSRAGSELRDASMVDLARRVMQETIYRAGVNPRDLDQVVLGNVVMPADAANPARVAAMQAGVTTSVPAMTVQRNCASGLESIAQAASDVHNGRAAVVLAAGAESMSNVPLLFPIETLGPVQSMMKARTAGQKLAALASFRPRHFKPVAALEQGLTDPLCGMIMGRTAEVLAHEFAISRADQDGFALRSHQRSADAAASGRFDDQIIPVYAGRKHKPVTADNGVRGEQSSEALAKLRPLFDRRDGTVTVGNACQITDGAAAVIVMNGQRARAEGHEVMGYVRAYTTEALDPSRMGLGPVFAISRLLHTTGFELDEIGLFEINEAFAAQVLACVEALASDRFCRDELGRSSAVGRIDPDCLNVNGGAIAMGHPVGASGTRIALNLLTEMRRRHVRLGIASLCAAGGQGSALLLERR